MNGYGLRSFPMEAGSLSDAVIDLAAIAHNVGVLRSRTRAQIMAVVKADAYGHGAVPAARAALAAGAALRVFTLGCRGLARVDFYLDGDRPMVNEVNTSPGFTPASQYPRMWAARGVGLRELLTCLIDTALTLAQPGG